VRRDHRLDRFDAVQEFVQAVQDQKTAHRHAKNKLPKIVLHRNPPEFAKCGESITQDCRGRE
jgi:hypothetical protein